jgi:hypothetical protein
MEKTSLLEASQYRFRHASRADRILAQVPA